MSHPVGAGTEPLTDPDDLCFLNGHLFVAFQNGVGAQGEASKTGNTASTIVELSTSGEELHQWDVIGKVDGLSADPEHDDLIATANEDGNSSLYVLNPGPNTITHYVYNRSLPHNGGTDAISIYHGHILISASAPGTTGGPPAPDPSYPALYAVTLYEHAGIAEIAPLFSDEAAARVANRGSDGAWVTLGLNDPDSNEVVPGNSPRFGGDFVLDSQGDQQLIFTRNPDAENPSLWVLNLSQSVNDTAWASDEDATLYASDQVHDTVDAVRGGFRDGEPITAATPCDANSATSSCGANFLALLDLSTGEVSPLSLTGQICSRRAWSSGRATITRTDPR